MRTNFYTVHDSPAHDERVKQSFVNSPFQMLTSVLEVQTHVRMVVYAPMDKEVLLADV